MSNAYGDGDGRVCHSRRMIQGEHSHKKDLNCKDAVMVEAGMIALMLELVEEG